MGFLSGAPRWLRDQGEKGRHDDPRRTSSRHVRRSPTPRHRLIHAALTCPRLHLDLPVTGEAEQEAEAARLVLPGASRVGWDSYPDNPDFVVLADPDGNRFRVADLAHEYT